jgi:hypothetical protein
VTFNGVVYALSVVSLRDYRRRHAAHILGYGREVLCWLVVVA